MAQHLTKGPWELVDGKLLLAADRPTTVVVVIVVVVVAATQETRTMHGIEGNMVTQESHARAALTWLKASFFSFFPLLPLLVGFLVCLISKKRDKTTTTVTERAPVGGHTTVEHASFCEEKT